MLPGSISHVFGRPSGATHDALRPQAAAAYGEGVPLTVFFVRLVQLTPATEHAGCEIEGLHLAAEGGIRVRGPDVRQRLLGDAAERRILHVLPAAGHEDGMRVQERGARADPAVPAVGRSPALHKLAVVALSGRVSPCT